MRVHLICHLLSRINPSSGSLGLHTYSLQSAEKIWLYKDFQIIYIQVIHYK